MTVVCLKGVMALLKNEGEERDCKGYVCESKVNIAKTNITRTQRHHKDTKGFS